MTTRLKRLCAATLALITVAVTAACGSAPPVPEDHFYRLQAVYASEPIPKTIFSGTIEVDRFIADGLTSERSIVYSQSGKPNQVKAYHYHFWIKPPAVMLRDEIVSFLRAAKIAKAIVTPELRVPAEYVLSGKINHFEQITGERNRVLLEVELSLRSSADGKLLILRSYRIDNESGGPSVAAAVDALNTALSIIYSDFVADLGKL
jgi:ABC-type uncharacterized transport system auxiliary subunit